VLLINTTIFSLFRCYSPLDDWSSLQAKQRRKTIERFDEALDAFNAL
jgi:hypothetical protein